MEFPIARGLEMPKQKVSYSERQEAKWYEGSIDYVINKCQSANNKERIIKLARIQKGDIPAEVYAKILNPYNTTNEKLLRFPATMRNYDVMADSIRRYVSEYTKAVHDFVVTAGDPDISFNRDAELKQAIAQAAQQLFVAELQQKMQQAQESGEEVQDPMSLMPSQEEFMHDFAKQQLDDMAVQSQALIDVIDNILQTELIYAQAYKDFICFGECYTYRTMRNNEIVIETVPLLEAFPVHSGKAFTEDEDMFDRRQYVTYHQIFEMYGDMLSGKQIEWLDRYYNKGFMHSPVHWYDVVRDFPDRCAKYPTEDIPMYEKDEVDLWQQGDGMYEHHTINWRGWAKAGILTRINEMGLLVQDTVDEDYQVNPMNGDLDIKWEWIPCIYEGVRIGTDKYGIYPIKARPIPFGKANKLCFNGIHELLPGLGRFSVIETVYPLQVFRNIIRYHIEMQLAKSKLAVLLLPKTLLGKNIDDTIYRMEAGGMLAYDDTVDGSSAKAQNVRMVEADVSQYIMQLEQICDGLKSEAREMVDMTAQRYGEIANNAGKGTTEEAIARGSMGSVILVFVFDKMRERDYQIGIEITKSAWVDGKDTHYRDRNGQPQYFSLDVNDHVARDYIVMVKNSAKETEKRDQLQQWAFNASQNGDIEIAAEAIESNSSPALVASIKKFGEMKRQHETELQDRAEALEKAKQQFVLEQIHAKGVEDRQTEVIKGMIAADDAANAFDADINRLIAENNLAPKEGAPDTSGVDNAKLAIDKMKIDVEHRKIASQNANEAANRAIELERMKNDLRIARTNKNKYDK